MVPVLTGQDLEPMVRFWRRLGLEVTAEFDGYVIMATDPSAGAAVEIHLAHSAEHDPRTTAGAVYLRVADAAALYERLRAELDRGGTALPGARERAHRRRSPPRSGPWRTPARRSCGCTSSSCRTTARSSSR